MPTILHTESSLGWGGQEGRILREAQGLREKGWKVIMACQPESGILREAAKDGFQCHIIKMRRSTDPIAVYELIKLFKQERVDLVVTHSSVDSWLTGWSAKLASQKPKVVRVRHLSGGIHTKLVYTHLCDAIVAISRDIKTHMVENKGIKAGKIHIIHSGIDTAKFNMEARPVHLRQEWGVGTDEALIGIVAVLRNKKGHRFLIRGAREILAKHPKTKFVFVGSGPKEEEITNEINELGLEKHFILTGARSDIPLVLNSLDIFVLPSQMEALGQAIVEAMSASLPVVASNVGGIPELVSEGRTGYLVPHSDVEALSGAIIKLLDNPERSREMGRIGRDFVRREFDYTHMIEKTDLLYKELLK